MSTEEPSGEVVEKRGREDETDGAQEADEGAAKREKTDGGSEAQGGAPAGTNADTSGNNR